MIQGDATREQSQEEIDANSQRNNVKLRQVIAAIPKGYKPTPAEMGLLDQYGYKIENGAVKHKSWWEINKSAVLSAAGVVGGGLAGAALSGAGAAGNAASAASAAGDTIPVATGGAATALMPAAQAGLLGSTAAAAVPAAGAGTMSTLAKYGKTAQGVSDVLGNAAATEAASNQARDNTKVQLENTRLNRDKFATDAPGTRLQTTIQAALAKGYKPSQVSWGGPGSGLKGEVPTYSGSQNFHDALADPQAQEMFSQLLQDELAQQKAGGTTGGNADDTMNTADIGQDSTGDKVLGSGATGAALLSAILKGLGH